MCSVEKVFLEISQNSQENTCDRAYFLIKLQVLGKSVFLWILRNFYEHLFYRAPLVAASGVFNLINNDCEATASFQDKHFSLITQLIYTKKKGHFQETKYWEGTRYQNNREPWLF